MRKLIKNESNGFIFSVLKCTYQLLEPATAFLALVFFHKPVRCIIRFISSYLATLIKLTPLLNNATSI